MVSIYITAAASEAVVEYAIFWIINYCLVWILVNSRTVERTDRHKGKQMSPPCISTGVLNNRTNSPTFPKYKFLPDFPWSLIVGTVFTRKLRRYWKKNIIELFFWQGKQMGRKMCVTFLMQEHCEIKTKVWSISIHSPFIFTTSCTHNKEVIFL